MTPDSEPTPPNLRVVEEQLRSLNTITEHGFKEVQRQLDDLRGLPIKFTELAGRVDALDDRLEIVETRETRGGEWRRGTVPIILLTLAIALAAVAQVIAQLTLHG